MSNPITDIYKITLDALQDKRYLQKQIYLDFEHEYYWSDDFSPEFYIAQAKAGFIAIAEEINEQELLLPEIQRSYAVLYYDNLHISKKVAKIIKQNRAKLFITTKLDEVAEAIANQHRNNWLSPKYLQILKQTRGVDPTFRAISVGLREDGELIAGEIGYIIGKTYTSLSGFSSRDKRFRNYGKAQMVLLGKHLHKSGIKMWNLGHPYMPYKTALGAKIFTRMAFLSRWSQNI